jgi:cytochrome c biogenesis protein CcmG/thiol:disulfide interchange protein DsbE
MIGLAPQPKSRRIRPGMLALQITASGFVLALLGLLIWRVVKVGRGENLVASIRKGATPKAPDFRLPVLWGAAESWPRSAGSILRDGRVSKTELVGHPVVLNFWASWCIPCRREAPRLVASARLHRGRVAFVGVDVQDFKSDARRFLRKYKVNYVSLREGGGTIYADFGLTGLPETYYVDASGRITGHDLGEVSRREIENGIALAARSFK